MIKLKHKSLIYPLVFCFVISMVPPVMASNAASNKALGFTTSTSTPTATLGQEQSSGKTIPIGSVIFDRPNDLTDMALSLGYVNDTANLNEVLGYIVEGSKLYIKNFNGKFIDNQTGLEVDKSLIPAVLYKDEFGNTFNVSAGDGSAVSSDLVIATTRIATLGSVLNISLTEDAKTLYPTAAQYQCYDNDGTAISHLSPLGTDSTVFPAKTAGDTVTVKLYAADGTQVGEDLTATLTNSVQLLTASAKSAAFGSSVKASLSNAGKSQYPTAVKFQIFSSDGNPISAVTDLDTYTTVYPAKTSGDSVVIKLYASDGLTQTGENFTVTLD